MIMVLLFIVMFLSVWDALHFNRRVVAADTVDLVVRNRIVISVNANCGEHVWSKLAFIGPLIIIGFIKRIGDVIIGYFNLARKS